MALSSRGDLPSLALKLRRGPADDMGGFDQHPSSEIRMPPSRARLSERLTADLLEALRRSGPRTGPAAALEAIHAAAGAAWTGLELSDFVSNGDGSPVPMAAIGRHPDTVAVTDGRSITLPGGEVATIRLEFGPRGGPP